MFQATLLTVPAGHNFDESWRLIRKSILEVLLQNGPKMRVIQEKYPHKSSSFFSMYRFDFMLHKDGSPYLMEVRKACGPAARVVTCSVFMLEQGRVLCLGGPVAASRAALCPARCDGHT